MKYSLLTPYKGSRHYIHGSDLFNAAQAAADIATGVKGSYINKLSFTRFAYFQCELVVDPDGTESDINQMGEGVYRLPDGQQKPFYLHEGKELPFERCPYDEDGMVSRAIFSNQAATLQAPIKYSSIEAVIALTKVLNYRLASPKSGKWVFGKIELHIALPLIMQALTITRTKSVTGRFSTNEIDIDGVTVGSIQFIVGAP
jgi:hypothetical protein